MCKISYATNLLGVPQKKTNLLGAFYQVRIKTVTFVLAC